MATLGCVRSRNTSSSSQGSPAGGGGGGGVTTATRMTPSNERWVMLNKDHFQRIFNETLLDEMTLAGGEGLHDDDEEDVGVGGHYREVDHVDEEERSEVGLNLVIRDQEQFKNRTGVDSANRTIKNRASVPKNVDTAEAMGYRQCVGSRDTDTDASFAVGGGKAKEKVGGKELRLAAVAAVHPEGTIQSAVAAVAAEEEDQNLDSDKTTASATAPATESAAVAAGGLRSRSSWLEARRITTGTGTPTRSRESGSEGGRSRRGGKAMTAAATARSSTLLPPPETRDSYAVSGDRKQFLVPPPPPPAFSRSDLAKSRPLVCAALFGEMIHHHLGAAGGLDGNGNRIDAGGQDTPAVGARGAVAAAATGKDDGSREIIVNVDGDDDDDEEDEELDPVGTDSPPLPTTQLRDASNKCRSLVPFLPPPPPAPQLLPRAPSTPTGHPHHHTLQHHRNEPHCSNTTFPSTSSPSTLACQARMATTTTTAMPGATGGAPSDPSRPFIDKDDSDDDTTAPSCAVPVDNSNNDPEVVALSGHCACNNDHCNTTSGVSTSATTATLLQQQKQWHDGGGGGKKTASFTSPSSNKTAAATTTATGRAAATGVARCTVSDQQAPAEAAAAAAAVSSKADGVSTGKQCGDDVCSGGGSDTCPLTDESCTNVSASASSCTLAQQQQKQAQQQQQQQKQQSMLVKCVGHPHPHNHHNNNNKSDWIADDSTDEPQAHSSNREEDGVHTVVVQGSCSPAKQANTGLKESGGGSGKRKGKKMSMKRGASMKGPMVAHQPERENWVTMSKSTLANLVDVLVGPGLECSDSDSRDTCGKLRESDNSSSSRSTYNHHQRMSVDISSKRGYAAALPHSPLAQAPKSAHGGGRDYSTATMLGSDMRGVGHPRGLPNPAHHPQIPGLVQQHPRLMTPAPAHVNSGSLSAGMTGGKQVLKQCWVALNKNVVIDMVDLAMGGSPNTENKDQPPEGAREETPEGEKGRKDCDEDGCSENSTDTMCSIHGPHGDHQGTTAAQTAESTSKVKGVRKRQYEPVSDGGRLSSVRKRTKRVESDKGAMYNKLSDLVAAPERPHSAPMESTGQIQESVKEVLRSPSPHSKEYESRRRLHDFECDRLMSWAKRCARANPAAGNSSAGSSSTQAQAPSDIHKGSGTPDSRESPKLGWVAVSKAHLHNIMDSVVSTMILNPDESDEDKSSHGKDTTSSPPPPSLVKQGSNSSPPAREASSAPHRPWLDPEPSARHHQSASHTLSASSSFSSSSSSNHATCRSPLPSQEETSSSPSDKSAASKAFKWKSRMAQMCQESPEREDTSSPSTSGSGEDLTSRATPSPQQQAQSPAKSDNSRRNKRKRRSQNKK